jgi:hypothetical protein
MKRFKTIAVVLGMALLCFAATAMAGEASFYDSNNEWIVRAYTEQTTPTSGVYSIFVEILNENGTYFTPTSEILLNGQALTDNPFLIDANQVTDVISIANKYVNGATEIFVFGTEVAGGPAVVHNHRTLSRDWPVPPANISVSGSGSFGNVNVGSSSTSYVTVSNTGEAALTLNSITVTGASFERDGGTCGTTVAGGSNCTIGVKFEPAAVTSYSGNLQINSSDGDTPTVPVPLSGTGVQQTGTADLIITSISGPTAASNNSTVRLTVYVKNQGTGSAGPSKVKTTKGTSTFLLDFDVPSIAAGQTVSVTGTFLLTCPVHATYYLYSNADGYLQVTESNESNNQRISIITCNR